MPVRPDIGSRLHGVEHPLYRVIQGRMQIQVLAKPGLSRGFLAQVTELRASDALWSGHGWIF
jgi:hypothetical protein